MFKSAAVPFTRLTAQAQSHNVSDSIESGHEFVADAGPLHRRLILVSLAKWTVRGPLGNKLLGVRVVDRATLVN